MIAAYVTARWFVHSSRTGTREARPRTAAVAAELAAAAAEGAAVYLEDWHRFVVSGSDGINRYWPMWVHRPPTPGTWAALHHSTHLPRLAAVRGRGEGLRIGLGENLAASNTSWSLIERGMVDVHDDTATITPIGWRLAAAHRRRRAAEATRRALREHSPTSTHVERCTEDHPWPNTDTDKEDTEQ